MAVGAKSVKTHKLKHAEIYDRRFSQADPMLPSRNIDRLNLIHTTALSLYFVLIGILDANLSVISTLAYGACLTLTSGLHSNILKITWPTLVFISISLIMTAYWGIDNPRAFLHGSFYTIYPVLNILLGSLLAAQIKEPKIIYRAMVTAGFSLSLFYIVHYILLAKGISGADISRNELRDTVGHGYLFSAIGAAIAVTEHKSLPWRRIVSYTISVICLLSIILSDSRTDLLSFAILLIVMGSPIAARQINAKSVSIAVFAGLIVTTPLLFYFVDSNSLISKSSKLESVQEVFAISYTRKDDINTRWRGYEASRAYNFVVGKGVLATAFGVGLGEEVPLNISIFLGDDVMTAIGKFHSIYSQLIVRGGFIGILLYILQMSQFATAFKTPTRMLGGAKFRRFGAALLACAVISGPTVCGIYSPGDTGVPVDLVAGMIASSALLNRRLSTPSNSRVNTSGHLANYKFG
jgi:hypothetical protein